MSFSIARGCKGQFIVSLKCLAILGRSSINLTSKPWWVKSASKICLETAVKPAHTTDVSHTEFPLPKVICGQVSWAEQKSCQTVGFANNLLRQDPPGKKHMNVEPTFYVEQTFYADLRLLPFPGGSRFPPSTLWLSPWFFSINMCFFQISWKLLLKINGWNLKIIQWKGIPS